MASYGWKFYLDYKAWTDSRRLFMRAQSPLRKTLFVAPLVFTEIPEGSFFDVATLDENREEREDAIGDVTGFLQAALDCAWEQGMRPTGFADHTNELKAVRYHLEDMRSLAKVPTR